MSFNNIINVHTNLLAALSGGPGACLCSPGWCGSPPEDCPLYLLSITSHLFLDQVVEVLILRKDVASGNLLPNLPCNDQWCSSVAEMFRQRLYTSSTTRLKHTSELIKKNRNSLTRRVHMWILLAAHALLCWIPLQTKTEGSCHLLNHPCPTFKGDKFTLPEEIHSDTLG